MSSSQNQNQDQKLIQKTIDDCLETLNVSYYQYRYSKV